ncbi:MAG: response regulator transcription factor [Spirochaetota bacterium]
MDEPKHGATDWHHAFSLPTDIAGQETFSGGLERAMALFEELVPADRGVSVIRMDGLIPFCLRWPDYASALVPRFNEYLNRRSPIYYQPPYEVLPVVDWNRYDGSEYHNEFNRPLGIRYSLGVGMYNAVTGVQYAVFVHRGSSGPCFSAECHEAIARIRPPLERILAMVSRTEESIRHEVHPRELEGGCEILSPREAEIAELLCSRLSMREIGDRLGISPRTVERHAFHIYGKLNVAGKRELIHVLGAHEPGVHSNLARI